MSKVEIVDDNSLENSGDGEMLGIGDESSFGSAEDKNHLDAQFLDTADEGSSYLKEITSRVQYRFVQMNSQDESTVNSITTDSPTSGGSYFVIGNPVEVFGASPQKKILRRDPLNNKTMTAKKRDDKRRATHNEVERRRRDKINTWIMKLAALVPNANAPATASKGGILAKACDYIMELTDKTKRVTQVEKQNEKLLVDILKLNEEVSELMRENSSLRAQVLQCHKPQS